MSDKKSETQLRLEARSNAWCRHRTPFTDEFKTCKTGVDFHQFDGPMDSKPCLGHTPEAIARCPHYSALTAEEVAARNAEREAGFMRILVIRNSIVQAIKSTNVGSGQIPCPACQTGTVGYSQARNGHIHAHCSTPKCASWME